MTKKYTGTTNTVTINSKFSPASKLRLDAKDHRKGHHPSDAMQETNDAKGHVFIFIGFDVISRPKPRKIFASWLNVLAQLIQTKNKWRWWNDWSLKNWYVMIRACKWGVIWKHTHTEYKRVCGTGIWQHVQAYEFKNTQENTAKQRLRSTLKHFKKVLILHWLCNPTQLYLLDG